jgi:hypothetical protein
MATVRGKETRQTETYRAEGVRGRMGEKGVQEDEWADRNNWRRKRAFWRNGRRKMWKHVQPAKNNNNNNNNNNYINP